MDFFVGSVATVKDKNSRELSSAFEADPVRSAVQKSDTPAMTRSTIALSVAVISLVGVVGVWKFGTIKSTGTPHGLSLRLPAAIATIMVTQEPYFPSLHRNPDKDRFRLDLLLTPFDDSAKSEMVGLVRSRDRSALQPMTKLLGADGPWLWLQTPEIAGVHLPTRRIVTERELREVNHTLTPFFATARFEFSTQLVAISPDRQQAYVIDANTLEARPTPPPKMGGWVNPGRAAETLLCAGGFIGEG